MSRLSRPGFTLIELLLVIAIVAVLASIVIVALNPKNQIGKAHDAARQIDLNDLVTALDRYRIDHKGNLPPGITSAPKVICQADVTPENCAQKVGGVNLRMLSGAYIEEIPRDPLLVQTGTGTQYMIKKNSNGTFTLSAPQAEREEISVTK